MNKIIKEQLNLCSLAKIPEFDDNTTELVISHGDTVSDVLKLNQNYLIELEDWVIHPTEDFNLSATWNSGVVPTSKQLKCTPTQFAGKMVRFDAVGYDEFTDTDKDDVYLGFWLARKAFKIIKKID